MESRQISVPPEPAGDPFPSFKEVLDHVVELPPAQDVDVTLAEKGVWRKKDPAQAPLPQPTVGRAR